MKEIERKFLVTSTEWKKCKRSGKTRYYEQFYLIISPSCSVRIRKDVHYITMTVKSNEMYVRDEIEFQIPFEAWRQLVKAVPQNPIRKKRSLVRFDGREWSIDEFKGHLKGLVLAEVELPRKEEQVTILPSWVGEEVTFDPRFYNQNLSTAYCLKGTK